MKSLAIIGLAAVLASPAWAEQELTADEPETHVVDGCMIGAAIGVAMGTLAAGPVTAAPGFFGGCFVGGVAGYYGPYAADAAVDTGRSAASSTADLGRRAFDAATGFAASTAEAGQAWWRDE